MSIQRLLAFSVAAAALFGTAWAAPVTVGDVTFAPKFQAKLEKTFGVREGEDLARDLKKSLERSLASVDAPQALRIDVEIVDARPNRPTFKQLTDTPGLSMQSIGVGGAALRGVLRDASGAEVSTVAYDWYETDINNVFASSTWTDANRAFRWFATRIKGAAAPAKPAA